MKFASALLVLSFFTASISAHAMASPRESQQNFEKSVYLDQHYGPHERQIFDLWLPKLPLFKKAPLVIYIHGGGFAAGSKDEMRGKLSLIQKYLQNDIAVAAINYRFLNHTSLQNIMREDIAGFVQFMRHHSKKYDIEPTRILSYGVSAGGSASLWLATHDDIANPKATDPVKRESSRILGAGHLNAQVSYDYTVWYEHFGKENTDRFMGSQVWTRYHFSKYEDIFTEEGSKIRQDLNMYGNLTSDDSPILFWNSLDDDELRDGNHFVHSPRHTRLLSEKAKTLGLKTASHIKADGTGTNDPHSTVQLFFGEILQESSKNARGSYHFQ